MPRRPPSDEKLLLRVVRLGQLMDAYGALLTDRQREFMRLHYEEDLSFGEIAAEYKVSRQAIHDAVKHAEKSLEEYESRLSLLSRLRPARDGAPAGGSPEVAEVLEAAIRRLRTSGVIYNSDWIVAELRRALSLLRGEGASTEGDGTQEEAV